MIPRTCDGCTECCKGWSHGSAYGHDFYPGKPCFYLAKNGCSIYEDRPAEPCKSYKCFWLDQEVLPMWMRPDLCGAVVVETERHGVVFYELKECGKKLDASVLSWFVMWAMSNQKNIVYQLEGGFNKMGSPEFLALAL